MPTDPVPPGLIPGRGPGLCPGAGSGLKAHGSSPGMTAAAGGGERRGIRAMAGSFMARFDAGSSGEGLVPPSAAGVLVLAGIQFSGWFWRGREARRRKECAGPGQSLRRRGCGFSHAGLARGLRLARE